MSVGLDVRVFPRPGVEFRGILDRVRREDEVDGSGTGKEMVVEPGSLDRDVHRDEHVDFHFQEVLDFLSGEIDELFLVHVA